MKLLVSGATGFIGSHVTARLVAEGHRVHAITRSSTKPERVPKGVSPYQYHHDPEALVSFMQGKKFDGVIHLATLFMTAYEPADIPELIGSNVTFATALLEAAVASGTRWFINTGTFSQFSGGGAYAPASLYDATKQAFEDIARYYIETSSIDFVTIRLNDTFGPRDPRPKLMNLFIRAAQTKDVLKMSPGGQQVDLVYIDNVVDGYIRMIQLLSEDAAHELKGRSFALNSGRRMTLRELAETFEQVTGTTLQIEWGAKAYGQREIMARWAADENVPGWEPNISLEEGIAISFDAHV